MKIHRVGVVLSLCLIWLASNVVAKSPVPKGQYVLWYTDPAVDWMTSALPLGNGRLGAMVFGDPMKEHIQFNDKSLWEGSKDHRGAYQNFGDIYIDFGQATYSDYVRSLDIEQAIANVSYQSNGTRYHRAYFISHPDNAIVMHIGANKKKKINFVLQLADAHPGITTVDGNQITISGKLTLISYQGILTVETAGGGFLKKGTH